ncbi:disks large-associated protein 2 [Haematobia irritans]|uniref:disks large-associated protein 2 n=1 Tax=Haematobia irritans TaxID=7368 RepID=UPI003F4F93C4
MDRSMDSIGSCSLDVDAESSDISDTSGSLNFPTPISIKDITREFTANIRERCSLQTVKNNTTAYVDPVTGQVCIALTTQPPTTGTVNNNHTTTVESHNKTTPTIGTTNLLSPQTPIDTYDKKPSYLNLACCVNGYSNITTYDSKIRQDINKSREVSPIRPSSSSLQYCKKSNSLAPPVLLTMPNVNVTSPHHHHHHHMASNGGIMTTIGTKYSIIENNNHTQNGGSDSLHNLSVGGDDGGGGSSSSSTRSFIQQRVERLYGPGALAQGFYSPKKTRDSPQRLNRSQTCENGGGGVGSATSELARKFQELSPSKDYSKFREKTSTNGRPSIPASLSSSAADNLNTENNNIDLPCLRHLSQEFRAQLPMVSPKRNFSRSSPGRELNSTITTTATTTQNYSTSNGTTSNSITSTTTTTTTINNHQPQHTIIIKDQKSQNLNSSDIGEKSVDVDEVDRQIPRDRTEELHTPTKLPPAPPQSSSTSLSYSAPIKSPKGEIVLESNSQISQETGPSVSINVSPTTTSTTSTSNGSVVPVKDAHFFLQQLKSEQNRLLEMAAVAEKYLDALTSNPDITEDTLGLLRSASGKARLLVSQKMKQFEGLCHNNLNSSPEDQFPTTVDDLQGFWDMVYLQVDHIDAIFKDIEQLKANEWKRSADMLMPTISSNSGNNSLKTPKTVKILKSRTNTPLTNGGGSGSNSVNSTPSAAALKREAQRKKLQEMKRRNREAMAAAASSSPAADASATISDNLIDGIEILAPKQDS